MQQACHAKNPLFLPYLARRALRSFLLAASQADYRQWAPKLRHSSFSKAFQDASIRLPDPSPAEFPDWECRRMISKSLLSAQDKLDCRTYGLFIISIQLLYFNCILFVFNLIESVYFTQFLTDLSWKFINNSIVNI